MLIPKKEGVIFLGHFKVILRPLEVMTPRSHLFKHVSYPSRAIGLALIEAMPIHQIKGIPCS